MYHGLVKLVFLDPFMAGAVCDFLWPHFLQYFREDVDIPLGLDACVRLVNDRICLEEPLDCLLSCASWILLLQSHKKPDGPSDFSRACLGFSLSQDTEAARTCTEAFSNALLRIRRKLRGGTLEDVVGKSSDPSNVSSHREKTGYCMLILSKILEVFINIVTIELQKAAETEKKELQAEILELVYFYESLEKERCMDKQRHSSKKGPSTSQELPVNKNNNRHHSPIKLYQERRPFLATSSIKHLFVTAIEMYNSDTPATEVPKTQVQSSSCKISDDLLNLISFSLKAFHHQIKHVSVQNDDSLKHPIVGDITLVGQPLLQLVWLLKSELKLERDQNIKEAKGKKNAGSKRGQLLLSLTCLNELFNVCIDRAHFVVLIQNLVSSELSGMDFEDRENADEGIQGEVNLENNLQEEIRAHNFLEKTMIRLYLELLALSFFHECEILSGIILAIANKLAGNLKDLHGIWAVSICKSIDMKNSRTARRLVGLAIFLRLPPHDLTVAHTMATELVQVVDSEDKDTVKESETYPVINSLTACEIASELLQSVESVIADLDWALSKMKVFSVGNREINGTKKGFKFWEISSGMLLDKSLYSRSEALVKLLSCFAEMKLKDSQAEQFLKLTAKFYKTLAQMTKQLIAPRGCKQLFPGQKFQKLAEGTCKKLTAPIYNFVDLMQQNQQENTHGKETISKIKRENRCIPDLIFQIEDYEKYLIKLSKLTKVNLLRYAKRSTARDFRIKTFKRSTASEEQQEEETSQVEKVTTQEEKSEGVQVQKLEEPARASSSYSQHESDEATVDQEEYIGSEKEVLECSDGVGPAVEDSDKEDQGMYILSKRAKTCNIVQDSVEDG